MFQPFKFNEKSSILFHFVDEMYSMKFDTAASL